MFHDDLKNGVLGECRDVCEVKSMLTPQEELMSESEPRRAKRSDLTVGDMQLSPQLSAGVSAELALVALLHD